jgi:FkbH-like protein
MKLQDALRIGHDLKERAGKPLSTFLAVGFAPLHLQTFLSAHLGRRITKKRIQCITGEYGDLIGALDAKAASDADTVAVVVEWADLDPRLGLRRSGGWTVNTLADASGVAEQRLALLSERLKRVSHPRIALVLPTLPMPPVFNTSRWQSGTAELNLRRLLDHFALEAARLPNVVVLSPAYLDQISSPGERRDVKSELRVDFPYTLEHASALAEALALLLHPQPPLKGLITDLDDTLWRGLIGEVGAANVSWTLDARSQIHALYQQLLDSLAESGTLIAVASKNNPSVAEALASLDLLIDVEKVFPIEIGWHAKSESVARILAVWNIASDAVAFVDDSAMDVAEVQSRFPDMHGFVFPTRKDDEAIELIGTLRDLFGKAVVNDEDRLRAASLRAGAELASVRSSPGSQEEFLLALNSKIGANFAKSPFDPRALDLVNKTNQFNLNGQRVHESEWRRRLDANDSFLLTISYADKFGPLGKIGVAYGRAAADELSIEGWVLSCRAFSRRIEHAMLQVLLDHFGVGFVSLTFAPTERNGPVADFLASLNLDARGGIVSVCREHFAAHCPRLYHKIAIDD